MKSHADIELQIIIAKKFKSLRIDSKKSQDDMAYMLGITRASICNIESGEHGLTIKLLLKSCQALNVSPLAILPNEREFYFTLPSMDEALKTKANKRIKELEEKLLALKIKHGVVTMPLDINK